MRRIAIIAACEYVAFRLVEQFKCVARTLVAISPRGQGCYCNRKHTGLVIHPYGCR
jgi:hypothetical protein